MSAKQLQSQSQGKENSQDKSVGKVSKDGKALHVSPDYLKQISKEDKLNPCVKPFLIIIGIIFAWWIILGTTYLGGVWHFMGEVWDELWKVVSKL